MHQAVASARIEGQEPTPETRAALDEFAAGRIDAEEMLRRLLDQR